MHDYDIIIIGAATGGLSAAIYGVRAGKSVLVLESSIYGGQIVNTPEVENYPGIANTTGYEFAMAIYDQAINLGAKVEFEQVIKVESEGDIKRVITTDKEYTSATVIIATGAKGRKLGIDGEERLTGAGVSYCATCDGSFFKGKDVAINGGGSTALEEAIYLSESCNKVYLVHRRDEFRGEDSLVKRLRTKSNVEFVLNATVSALIGDVRLEAIEVTDVNSKEVRKIAVSGIFVAIGRSPETGMVKDVVELDKAGYVIAGEDCETNVPGIYVAGDCRTKKVRQLVTAAADGAVAALAAAAYIG